MQQSAAWDTPEVWVQTETGEYRCGSEIISYNGDGYKKAVDVINSALEAFKEQYKLLMEPYMPTLVIGAEVAAVEPGAFGEALLLVAATTISVYALFNAIKNDPNSMFKPIDLDDFDLPHLVTEPLPEEESDNIETLPTDEEKKGDDIETMPTDSEEKGNNTESVPLPEENKDLIVEAEETEGENSNNQWQRMTSKESQEAAAKLGYEKTNYRAKNGEPIYYNRKTKTYISQDIGSADGSGPHNGGVWKMAKTPEGINSKATRIGTFNADLERIGD